MEEERCENRRGGERQLASKGFFCHRWSTLAGSASHQGSICRRGARTLQHFSKGSSCHRWSTLLPKGPYASDGIARLSKGSFCRRWNTLLPKGPYASDGAARWMVLASKGSSCHRWSTFFPKGPLSVPKGPSATDGGHEGFSSSPLPKGPSATKGGEPCLDEKGSARGDAEGLRGGSGGLTVPFPRA